MLYPSVNRQKSWLLFLLLAVITANLYFHFTFNSTLQDRANYLDGFFTRILHPVQYAFHTSQEWAKNGSTYFARLANAEKDNQKLKSVNSDLQLKLAAFEEVRAENERLKGMLQFRSTGAAQFIGARVISRDLSLFFRTIEIDRGRADGVEDSFPVVSPDGAVGKILSAGSRSSTVLLITDVNSRIDAVVQRSRTHSIVGGSPQGDLALRYLPRRYDVHEGDQLVTSGLGGFFPSGFKIGSVVAIARDPNFVLEEAVVEPAVDFDALEEVFVVKNGKSNGS